MFTFKPAGMVTKGAGMVTKTCYKVCSVPRKLLHSKSAELVTKSPEQPTKKLRIFMCRTVKTFYKELRSSWKVAAITRRYSYKSCGNNWNNYNKKMLWAWDILLRRGDKLLPCNEEIDGVTRSEVAERGAYIGLNNHKRRCRCVYKWTKCV